MYHLSRSVHKKIGNADIILNNLIAGINITVWPVLSLFINRADKCQQILINKLSYRFEQLWQKLIMWIPSEYKKIPCYGL